MNKITAYISGILMVMLCVLSPADMEGKARPYSYPGMSDEEMRVEIRNLGKNIQFKYTREVREYIERYSKPGRAGTERILERIPVYFPQFEAKLEEKGLPEELKILAIVESHLNVGAYSKAGAAGLWQLIKGTAKHYDLEVRGNYDERYAVEESTEAALNFLQDLYNQFGDWTLALAAYNCGPGNVKKAIKLSGGKRDFWKIKKYLPKETRNYVPKFVAISYILKHYREYGIEPSIPDKNYFNTADARVYRHLTFKEIADITGVPMEVIKNMNYAYRKNYIPASTSGYKLTLPVEALYTLISMDENGKIEFIKEHKYDYSKYILANFDNDIAASLLGYKMRFEFEKIVTGIRPVYYNKITIPRQFRRFYLANKRRAVEKYSFSYYKLKPGESMTEVAMNLEVPLDKLMRWNNLNASSPQPRAGSFIRIKEKY